MSRRYSRSSVSASYSGWPWQNTKGAPASLTKMSAPAVREREMMRYPRRAQGLLRQRVAARMRQAPSIGQAAREPVRGFAPHAIDHRRQLAGQPHAFDAIEMQHRRMRREARPQDRHARAPRRSRPARSASARRARRSAAPRRVGRRSRSVRRGSLPRRRRLRIRATGCAARSAARGPPPSGWCGTAARCACSPRPGMPLTSPSTSEPVGPPRRDGNSCSFATA